MTFILNHGNITFTGNPKVIANSDGRSPIPYGLIYQSTDKTLYTTSTRPDPLTVDVKTGITYNFSPASDGVITVTDVECTFGSANDNVKLDMTFKLLKSGQIDPKSVTIEFTSLIAYWGPGLYIYYAYSNITNYNFYLPYSLNIYGSNTTVGTASGTVG